jgi:hypothetical protein
VYINPYQCEIDVQWLQQLEFYPNVHNIVEDKNMAFSQLKFKGHAQSWWEIHIEMLGMEGSPPITKWEVFKTLIKPYLYSIGYGLVDPLALLSMKERVECTIVHH